MVCVTRSSPRSITLSDVFFELVTYRNDPSIDMAAASGSVPTPTLVNTFCVDMLNTSMRLLFVFTR